MSGKYFARVLFILLFLACSEATQAQDLSRYVLNMQNGLPSNHAYYPLVGTYGYLWISTERGVVKYNGYTTRLFNKQSGIGNDDIWHMYLDKKNRLWLSSINNEIGYIYNNQYKKAYNANPDASYYINQFADHKDGVQMANRAVRNGFFFSVDSESHDTIYERLVNRGPNKFLLNSRGEIYIGRGRENYKLEYVNNAWKRVEMPSYPQSYNYSDSVYASVFSSNHYYVSFHQDEGPLYIFNIFTGDFNTISIQPAPDEKIVTFVQYTNYPRLITNRKVIALDSNMCIARIYPGSMLIGADAEGKYSLTNFVHDSLWGMVTTTDNGTYIGIGTNMFYKQQTRLSYGYEYVGRSATGLQYWWHPQEKKLAQLDEKGDVRMLKNELLTKITAVIPYDATRSIVMGNVLFFIDDNALKIKAYYADINYVQTSFDSFNAENLGMIRRSDLVYGYHKISDSACYQVVSSMGLRKVIVSHDSLTIHYVADIKITGIAYDSLLNMLWAYGYKGLRLYDVATNKRHNVGQHLLSSFGINKIEQMFTDKYGNVYVKDNSRLLVFNYRTRTIKKLFPNYKLEDAVVAINNNHLAVAGSLGVLFCEIKGAMQFSSTIAYRNVKHINYNYLLGKKFALTDDSVIIGTDKGMYSIPAPKSYTQNRSAQQDFRLIWYYGDTIQELHKFDTVNLNHEELNIRLEVINPKGFGLPTYSYKIGNDGEWSVLNSNELHFDELLPDTYYDLWVVVNDYEWRSDAIHLKVYLQPRWWESYYGRRFVWLGIALLIICAGLGIAYVTKRIVDRRNRDRNVKLELKNLKMALELKSIYAQINPHFIFNTLSTGLYFIKKGMMKEAYSHITTFSDLLRSFLKASRNKYINLEEDIENLENYIRLQLTRFENRFEYEIEVSPEIDTEITLVPSLLLQPIVENAIHHGLFHKEGRGRLYLGFKKGAHSNELVCIIDDNGIGREQSKLLKEQTTTKTQSYGTDMVKELINTLNQHEPIFISIEYIDKQPPETGTRVIITIKYLNNAT